MKKSVAVTILLLLAVLLFVLSGYEYLAGQDKLTNYYNSENFPSLNRNAYVGGDAYNYIINGNYATGCFVLAVGGLVSGVICVCSSIIVSVIPEKKKPQVSIPTSPV